MNLRARRDRRRVLPRRYEPATIGYLSGRRGGPSLIPDPVRAQLVATAFETFAAGESSMLSVLRSVNAAGLRTRRDRPLSPQTLQAMLRNGIDPCFGDSFASGPPRRVAEP